MSGMFNCCEAGPPLSRGKGSSSMFGGSGNAGSQNAMGSHSILRNGPLTGQMAGPRMRDFILAPWLIAVLVLLITVVSCGTAAVWVVAPGLIVCGVSAMLAWEKYRNQEQPLAIFYILCSISGFAALIVSAVTYVHFLQPYYELGLGATYLDMLPSQSALGASDASAIVFAEGTSVDTSRSYGFVDGRNPSGTIYCVAPVSNHWTLAEPGVQFFAAGTNCCGKLTGFGCIKGGTGARGATILASEERADPGFIKAVEGAAVAHQLQPGTGYLLLNMVKDPMEMRTDRFDSAVRLLLIYAFVYLWISCMTGYMAHNMMK